jgi:hypothetical protein
MSITESLFIFSLQMKKGFCLMPTKIYEHVFELANLCNGLLVFQVGGKQPEVVVRCLTSAAFTLPNTMQLNTITTFPISVTQVLNFLSRTIVVDE